MTQANDQITLSEAIKQVLIGLEGPISTDEFCDRVLAIRPSSAKNPKQSIRTKVRWDMSGRMLAFLDSKTIVPLHVAMRGVRFRIPLSSRQVELGAVSLYPALYGFHQPRYDDVPIEWMDAQGRPLPAAPIMIQEHVENWDGRMIAVDKAAIDMKAWMIQNRAQADDHILVTVVSWLPKCFHIELEPAEERERRRQEIEARNCELADIFWRMLEASRQESLFLFDSVVTAHIRLANPQGYPGDPWFEVISKDPRMATDGWQISYRGNVADWEDLFEEEMLEQGEVLLTEAEARQVYIFKANLKHRPGLWRRIEIQGQNTLADFNSTLVGAFEHDWDHLGGFWQLVPRGKTGKRVREIDLGSVDPFGDGDGAETRIAELDLKPGARLKYVFDFGDWIEHEIELEALSEPEIGAEYPRVVAQNRPRNRYCIHCQKQGIKTVATYICIDCSELQERQVWVCDKCADEHHEDHYLDEILY